MRKVVLIVVAVVVVAGAVAARWFTRGPSYAPVIAKTALDGWRAPWPEGAAAASEPRRRKRWIVIGWDGAGWDLALPLVDAGKMPNLAGPIREGAYGDMCSFKPTWSPVLWTTVATGVDPSRHGILAMGRVEKGTERRPWIRLPQLGLRGLPAGAVDPAHLLRAASPADQREARAVS